MSLVGRAQSIGPALRIPELISRHQQRRAYRARAVVTLQRSGLLDTPLSRDMTEHD
jgi:ABC-type Fe3+/spermidine/putrescine transport system ATPase subunit